MMMMTTKTMSKMDRHKRKKIFILIIIYLLLAAILFFALYSIFGKNRFEEKERIYAGIGGAINNSGVYEITEETQIYELILFAKGLSKRADIRNLDTNALVIPWEVYCIPYLPKKTYTQLPKKIFTQPKDAELVEFKRTKKINIVYAGLPRTYMLISIIPEQNLITITHIPWYTRVTPDSEYPRTLYEVYLTGGVPFLNRAIKRVSLETIDYYFTQNRNSWINFIDYLGGISVNVPDNFALEYGIPKGENRLNGILAWEYISFISKPKRSSNQWVTGSEKRIEMQKEFMQSMYNKFKDSNFFLQGEILKNIMVEAETNMKSKDFISIVNRYKKMKNPQLKLITLPGVMQKYNDTMMYVPDINNYKLRQKEIYLETIQELNYQ